MPPEYSRPPPDETLREAFARQFALHEERIRGIQQRQDDRMKMFEEFRLEVRHELKVQNEKIDKHGAWINKALGMAIIMGALGWALAQAVVEWVKR